MWWGPKKVSRLNLQIEKYKLKVKEQEEPQKLWFLPTNAATWSNGAAWQVDQLIKLKRLSVQRKNTNQEENIARIANAVQVNTSTRSTDIAAEVVIVFNCLGQFNR